MYNLLPCNDGYINIKVNVKTAIKGLFLFFMKCIYNIIKFLSNSYKKVLHKF